YAIGLLRRWMGRAVLSTEEESGLRALLLAFQRRPSVEELMAEALAEKSATPAERQLLVLETMGQANFSEIPAVWTAALAAAIRRPDLAVRRQAVRTAAVLQITKLDDDLEALAGRKDEQVDLRLEALRGIILRRPALSDSLFDLLLGQLAEDVSPLIRL